MKVMGSEDCAIAETVHAVVDFDENKRREKEATSAQWKTATVPRDVCVSHFRFFVLRFAFCDASFSGSHDILDHCEFTS
jgi:hypothetical protein